MYTNFFALKEIPFSIAPNPDYLFMSARHKEALAHLTYGLGSSNIEGTGGFVLLTGEVGTGKTTISRCLMSQLPENTQAAFILNPTLSSQELLATICDEFKVRYRKTGATLKTLTDKIQEKLLNNHQNNINTLLIIDEAQHLQPEVLEQLRLLTNLETNTKKLLQVILIGQPELQQLLQRRDLRQLAQRITARYHLLPLTLVEVQQYIKHRLSVADCHRTLFDEKAVKEIHRVSQGIPRLINLLCHHALMIAYNQNDALVNKKIITKAAIQALGDEAENKKTINYSWVISVIGISLLLALMVNIALTYNVRQAEPLIVNEQQADSVQILKSDKTIEHEKKTALSERKQDVDQTGKKKSDEKNDQIVKLQAELIKLQTQQLASQQKQLMKDKQLVIDDTVKAKPLEKLKSKAETPEKNTQQLVFDAKSVDGVSDELLARFQSAIAVENKTLQASQADNKSVLNESSKNNPSPESKPLEIKSISQMPAWVQQGVPSLVFEQHVYASDGQGWVKVNGKDKRAGDTITSDLTLVDILPQKVILNYRGETFSLPALTNW